MTRISRTKKHFSPRADASLHFEQLEKRIALTANVSGDVFWDANRNGLYDDDATAPAGVTVSLQANPGQLAINMNLVGTKAPYSISGVSTESDFAEIADLDALVAAGFELTSPLSNNELSIRDYSTLSNNPISKPSWVEAADLDGINGPDLIVANFQGSKLTILLDDGAGVFSTRSEIPVAVNSTSIATADFDGDGDLDVAVGNLNANALDVLINDGSGTFSSPSSVMKVSTGSGPSSIVAADVNQDGKIDLVASNFWDHTVSVFLNQSSAAQVDFAAPTTFDVGPGSNMIELVELGNQPGSPSLVVLDVQLDQLLIFNNDGNGNFTFSGAANSLNVNGSRSITAGRIDEDAFDDIVVHDPLKQEIRVYFGNGNGGFETTGFASPKTVWFPRGVALADMDGDGDTDLVANLIDGNPPVVLRNEGNRRISDAFPLNNVPLDAVVTSPPALADFNGDGVVDIAYSPAWLGGTIRVSLRQLGMGQQVVRTNEGNLTGRDFGVARIVSAASTSQGDYEGNGLIDSLDLKVWEANFGKTAGPGMSADGNASGRIDGLDALHWLRNFGKTVAAGEVPLAAMEAVGSSASTAPVSVSLNEATGQNLQGIWFVVAEDSIPALLPSSSGANTFQFKDEAFHQAALEDSRSQIHYPTPDVDYEIRATRSPGHNSHLLDVSAGQYLDLATLQSEQLEPFDLF